MLKSTRSDIKKNSYEAILDGIAPDGGLYIFDSIPKIDYHKYLSSSYLELAGSIISKFLPEFSYDELAIELKAAYSSFDIDNVVDIKKLDNSYILELFHGPTLAFKDLALVVLPRLMKISRDRLGYDKKITILTATSGDTGGAALNGFKEIDGIDIVVLYPNGGVSEIQEAQMNSFKGNGAYTFAINGNFDDCQSYVKKFFKENEDLSISSANSINIGRLVPQIVYYFYTYIYLLKNNEIKDNEEISFDVPTGNFGNILAGMLAKMAGLPIKSLICSSNKNNVLYNYFNTGIYDRNREFYKTNSPSMDILISSNLERFLYLASKGDTSLVNRLMEDLKNKGKYYYKNPLDYFYAYYTDEETTLRVIKEVYNKYNYLIDPHTAVAYNAYLSYKNNHKEKVVILSTAHPYKFPSAIMKAFNIDSSDNILKTLESKLGLKIPKALNYKEYKREIYDIDSLDELLRGIIE